MPMIALIEKLPAKKIIFMIVLLFIPLFLFYLSVPGLWDEDESVYTEISRQMLIRHDLVGTYFNYEPRYDKPPLNFWITAAFYKAFGMNEFTSRMSSTFFGFLCLILVLCFGKRLFNKRTGILAALMLGTGFLFFIETQMALIDTSLTFCIGLTLYFFYRGFAEARPNFLLLMGFPLGLGVLAKGPIALILSGAVGLIFATFQIFKHKVKWRVLFNWQLMLGFIIALAICLPWYFTMGSRYGMDFIRNHFGYHMIERFTKPIESHGGGWYFAFYYLVILVIGFIPWSAYIAGAFRLAVRHWSDSRLFFILTWFVVIFGFFTISQTKLPGYALPFFPPIAILMGFWWNQLLGDSKAKTNPWWGMGIQFLVVLGFVTFIAIQRAALPSGYQGTVWVLFLLPVCLILSALVIWVWRRRTQSYEPFFKVNFFTFYIFWALFLLLFVPIIENYKPVKYLAVELRQYLTDRDKVISALPSNYTAPFYTRHKVIFVTDNLSLVKYYQSKSRVFAIVTVKSLNYLKSNNLACYQLSHYGSGYLIVNQPLK
jgi:4-amino-4-deoxy-L-arabinose transferase-like glycosyltransferase